MKKRFITVILIICILILPISEYTQANAISGNNQNITIKYDKNNQKILDNIPQIGCSAVYIAEPITGKIIYEKNAHEKMYPASTTKILTALVVMENCELTDKVIVSQNAIDLVPEGYSNANLKAGEELDVETLLYALLIPSANEAANALAEHVSGSIEAFANLCNNRAKELGCEMLHFVNANGLHDENHYCSAYDLYLIAKECQKYDIFNKIVSTKTFTVPATNIYPKNDRTFKNTNELLLSGTYYYSYCTGIKTGHTTLAGECLVASSLYNDMNLISVVLGGSEKNSQGLNERFYDTKKLFEFTYSNYSIKEIIEKNYVVDTIDVKKATKDTKSLDLIVGSSISTILPNSISKEDISIKVDIYENITAPIEQNQVLGHITFFADGLEYTVDVVASHSVEKLPYYMYNTIILVTAFLIIARIVKRKKSKKKKKHKKIKNRL